MANYNKSFSFRNGVQVDEDNFFVNANGLVGIGTTIPRTNLDVYGDISVSGLSTMKAMIISGIASFVDLRVGSYITMTDSGIISATRYYGDGSYLDGIPTNQWVDYNQPGITSSYILRNRVGIATNIPTQTLQIGGRTELGQIGVGINSTGNIRASGIITAGSFDGSGTNITNINASNISSGTLDNARLPNNINLPSGIATVGTLTATRAYIGVVTFNSNGLFSRNVTGSSFTGGSFYASNGFEINSSDLTFSGGARVSIAGSNGNPGQFLVSNGSNGVNWSSDISVSGIVTVGILTANDIFSSGFTTTSNLRVTNTGIVTTLNVFRTNSFASQLTQVNSGIITTNSLNSTYSNIGVTTAGFVNSTNINASGVGTISKLHSGNIRINDVSNKIETNSGDLFLGSAGTKIEVSNNLYVSGNSYLAGIVTSATGIVPDSNNSGYLGSSAKSFAEAYIDEVQIGVANAAGIVSTRSGALSLDSNTGTVSISKDLSVSRNSTFSGISTFNSSINISGSLNPNTDLSASLGSSTKSFAEAYIDEVQIGVANAAGIVSTRSGDLSLDANSRRVSVVRDFSIGQNLSVTGISTLSGLVNITTGIIPSNDNNGYLGSSTKSFAEAYIDEVQIGVTNAAGIVSTRSGDLSLDANTGKVSVVKDFIVNRNVSVTGISTLSGLVNITTGIIPTNDNSGYLGSSSKSLAEAYIDEVQIGVANAAGIVSTRSGDLSLDSNTGKVSVVKDFIVNRNLSVTGISTLTDLIINDSVVPDSDGGSYLGSAGTSFANAHIANINIGAFGAGIISTRSGNLTLDSITGRVLVSKDLISERNLNVSGILTAPNLYSDYSIVNINISPDSDKGSSIGYAATAFENAYINEVTIGVAGTNSIGTRNSNTLQLTSSSGIVTVTNSLFVNSNLESNNLNIIGIATVGSAILPISNNNGSVGSSSKAFGSAYFNKIRLGVSGSGNIIDTAAGELILQSTSSLVRISDQLIVDNEIYSGPLYVDSSYVGIGTTTSLSSKLEVVDQSTVSIKIDSKTSNSSLILSSSSNQGRLIFGGSDFTFENRTVGSFNFNLHSGGVAGINTGSFKWNNSYLSNEIMTLTYDGKLGINQDEPQHNLHVVGTSTITSDTYIGNDLYVNGKIGATGTGVTISRDLYVGNGLFASGVSTFSNLRVNGNTVITGITTLRLAEGTQLNGNVFTEVGISTFNELSITGIVSITEASGIGIGTTSPNASIHIITEGGGLAGGIISPAIAVGVNTNDVGNGGIVLYQSGQVVSGGSIRIVDESTIEIDSSGSIGIGTDEPTCKADFFYAGVGIGSTGESAKYAFMLPPGITSDQRVGLHTRPGAFIFNTTVNKHQMYNGTTWYDMY